MKNTYFPSFFCAFLINILGCSLSLSGQDMNRLVIDASFQKGNIVPFSQVNDVPTEGIQDFFYFSFKNELNTVTFSLENHTPSTKNLVLEMSNALLERLVLSKVINTQTVELFKTGIDYDRSTRPIDHRLFAFPLQLAPFEVATYQLRLEKESGKPLVTSVTLKTEAQFNTDNSFQLILIGLYYGVSLLSLFFSLFIFYILRNYSYLIYAGYIVFFRALY